VKKASAEAPFERLTKPIEFAKALTFYGLENQDLCQVVEWISIKQ